MKYLLLFILTASTLSGCSLMSGSKKPAEDDSLHYYPPTPGLLDKNEFRKYYRQISMLMDTGLLNGNFNGGILIAKDGNIIYEKYQGLKNLKGNDSVNAETPFHIASTTKTFTAAAVLQLVQQGKLNLNDSLEKFFPGFPYRPVTVRMLLNHRSGLPNYIYFIPNSKWNKKKMVYNEDVLGFLFTKKPKLEFTAGTRFSYSNTNFVLLAMIIEKISGQAFPAYIQEHVFTPLQMSNSFVFTWNDSAKVILSYSASGNPWQNDYLEGTYGDKNVYSTPRDLLKWDQALYTEQIVSKALLDSAFAPYSFETPSIHNYGLGWRMMLLTNGKKVIYHNGRWHGFNSSFARLTDDSATVIILSNRQTWKGYETAYECYNVFGNYFPKVEMEPEESDSLIKISIKPPAKMKKLLSPKKTKR